MRLDRIMTSPVETILPGATAAEAKALMARARVHHLVVLGRGGRITGVLCTHDLRGTDPDTTVGDLMSAPAVTLSARADVQDAAKLLRRRNVGCLPLTDRGRLVGIVTAADLLALLGKGTLRVQARSTKWILPKRGPTHRPTPRRA